jgi:phage-related minor tail protein
MTNVLFTFGNVTGKTFTKANELALDLSVAFGKDLSSSAVMVGKALNNPAKGLTALSRIGVSFTTQQEDQVKAMMEVGDIAGAQKIILAELSKQVSGSAKAQADGIAKTVRGLGQSEGGCGRCAAGHVHRPDQGAARRDQGAARRDEVDQAA